MWIPALKLESAALSAYKNNEDADSDLETLEDRQIIRQDNINNRRSILDWYL